MLQMRPGCECCDRDLPPDSADARICSFECTFCSDCASRRLAGTCPNCGGELLPRPSRAAAKLEKYEARVDWRRTAAEIGRQVRAFDPFPGATARVRGTELKVWRASVVDGAGDPGAVIAVGPDGVVVAGGSGAIRLEELQRAGGKRLPARAFLRGFPLVVGERFEPPATD